MKKKRKERVAFENRETMREHNIQYIAHFSYYTNANGLLLVVLKKRGSVNTPPPLTVSRERSERVGVRANGKALYGA